MMGEPSDCKKTWLQHCPLTEVNRDFTDTMHKQKQ